MKRVVLLMSIFLALGPALASGTFSGIEGAHVTTGRLRALAVDDGARRTLILQPVVSGTRGRSVWLVAVQGVALVSSDVRLCGWNTFGSLHAATPPPISKVDALLVSSLCAWLLVVAAALVFAVRVMRPLRAAGWAAVPIVLVLAIAWSVTRHEEGTTTVERQPRLEVEQRAAHDLTVLEPAQVPAWLAERDQRLWPFQAAALEACSGPGWRVIACSLGGATSVHMGHVPPPLRIDLPATGDLVLPRALSAFHPVDVDLTTIAPTRLRAPGLDAVRCTKLRPALDPFTQRPSLAGVAWPADGWVTRLRGRLEPATATQDLPLTPDGAGRLGASLHEVTTLPLHAVALVVALAACGLVFLPGPAELRGRGRRRLVVISLALAWPSTHLGGTLALVDEDRHAVTVMKRDVAVSTLKSIEAAQGLFREGDKEGDGTLDHGTLAELSQAALVDSVTGQGRSNGYRFAVTPHPETPEFLWSATADPESGGPSFFIDDTGVIREGVPLEVDYQADADDAPILPR